MKYVVIGAGGTGGAIAAFMARAGKDVTVIARGKHLEVMQKQGLIIEAVDETYIVPVKACTMDAYDDKADVIFVCVKGYSLEDTVPFITRASHNDTVVIPILNIYGTGGRLQRSLPQLTVTDGCIYIAAQIKEPGTILMSGTIFRVVYGLRKGTTSEVEEKVMPVLKQVEQDLKEAKILPILSQQIEKDALQKFSMVSPMAASGAYYDEKTKVFQQEGKYRDTYIALIQEVYALSQAMDIALPENIVEINCKIMDDLVPGASASMHRDIKAGKPSEVDGLVYEVVRLGQEYGVPTPTYAKIATELLRRLEK